MKKNLLLALGTCAVVGASIGVTYASDVTPDTCHSLDRSAVEAVLAKQAAGSTLTDSETTLLSTMSTCKAQMEQRFGSGRLDRSGSSMMIPRSGSGHLDRDNTPGSGSGMRMPQGVNLTDTEKETLKTMTDAEKKAFFESKGITMGSGMVAPQDGKQGNKKTELRAKIQSSHAKSADALTEKYMKSIDSKTTDEKMAAIDAFLSKIAAAQTKIQSSSYSDAVKTKYSNVLDYMKQLFEDQKSSLSSDSGEDANIIDSLLQ